MDVAFTMWRMPDDTTRTVKVSQDAYDEFAVVNGAVGDAPGRPSPDAVFLMAVGGTDDVDDYPWQYRSAQADEPKNGFSVLTEHVCSPTGVRCVRSFVRNHRSVSIDGVANGSAAAANSLTISLTITSSQSNLYVCGMLTLNNNHTLSSSSYNSVSMTTRDSNTANAFTVFLSDLVNPATGTHNGVFTPNTKSDMAGGFLSAYGVNQTTPRRATANNNGTSNAPTLTITSASGDLAVSHVGYDGSTASDTPDLSWTGAWNVSGPGNTNAQGRYIAGSGSSVTRTDSFNNSAGWAVVGASLQSAPVTGTHRLPLLGVGN